MQENHLAQPSDLRVPGNPRYAPSEELEQVECTVYGVECIAEMDEYEIHHVWIGDGEWDVRLTLPEKHEEAIWEAYYAQRDGAE